MFATVNSGERYLCQVTVELGQSVSADLRWSRFVLASSLDWISSTTDQILGVAAAHGDRGLTTCSTDCVVTWVVRRSGRCRWRRHVVIFTGSSACSSSSHELSSPPGSSAAVADGDVRILSWSAAETQQTTTRDNDQPRVHCHLFYEISCQHFVFSLQLKHRSA